MPNVYTGPPPRWSSAGGGSSSNVSEDDCNIDESLRTELERKLNVVMEYMDHAEEMQFANQGIKQWLVDLKHTIYDADTLLDHINTEAQFKEFYEADGSFTSDPLRHASSQMEKITKELTSLVAHAKDMGLEPRVKRAAEAAKKTQVADDRITASVRDESDVVHGRKAEKKMIMEQVLSSHGDKVGVIAIVGMGGLGKTTLAQFVYNHPDVERHFDKRSWACVSDSFDLLRVTRDILESLTGCPVSFSSLDKLQKELKEELRGRRFLIVLDDVWELSDKKLKNLRAPFSSAEEGSKVIVTTRHQRVASALSADYRLSPKLMSEDEGWSLFSNDVFCDDDPRNHPELEAIGKEIVMKCDGLPLAIKTLSGLLRSEKDEKKWQRIQASSFWQLPEGKNDILPALGLSYSYLPSHLKRCFAYCSLFPKDYRFSEEELVNLWIDEGFVKQSDDHKRIEDVGKAYFTDLLSRSFFTVQYSRYVMHDLIHDLAQMVCADFHQQLDQKAAARDCNQQLAQNTSAIVSKKIRHVSFQDSRECSGSLNVEALSQIRSLQTVMTRTAFLNDKMLRDICLQHLSLRVLCLRGSRIRILPDTICNLKLLRRLDVSFTDVEELPASLGKLYNLRSLLCYDCHHLKELHFEISALVSLRRFTLSGMHLQKAPQNLSQLTECKLMLEFYLPYLVDGSESSDSGDIQTDESVSAGTQSESEELLLRVHVEIDKTRFSYCRKGRDFACADHSDLLESLRPHRDLEEVEIEDFSGTSFPDWLGDQSYRNIVKVELHFCRLSSGIMPALGQLPSLKILSLKKIGNLKRLGREFYNNCKDPFRSLEELSFKYMEEWEDWEPDDDDDDAVGAGKKFYPRLEKLELDNCPRLKGRLPAGLPSLKMLSIDMCPSLMELNNEYPQLTALEIFHCGPCLVNSYLVDNKFQDLYTSLQSLSLGDCDCVESFPEKGSLPPSLTSLEIVILVELKRLDGTGLHSLSCLKELRISDCPKLEALPEEGLPRSLTRLTLSWLPSIKRLDEFRLQNLTSLEYLGIFNCPNLEALPEEGLPHSLTTLILDELENLKTLDGIGLQNLTSLKELSIWNCPKLEALLEEGLPRSLTRLALSRLPSIKRLDEFRLQNLTSLEYLRICDCSARRRPASLSHRTHSLGIGESKDIGWDWPSKPHIT